MKKKVIKKEKKSTPTKKVSPFQIDVFNTAGKVVEKIELPKEIFGAKINPSLLAQAVRVYLKNQQKGTVATKTRGEVKGSGRKIYRQKGTGRARHGDRYAPIFVGGGVAFGPKPRDFNLSLPQKMRRAALFGALASKFSQKAILVVEGLLEIPAKTKEMVKILKNLKLEPQKGQGKLKILLILPKKVENVKRAARNIKGVIITPANLLNTHEVLSNERLIIAKDALGVLEKTFLETKKKEERK